MRNSAFEVLAIENPQLLPDSIIDQIQRTSQDAWSRISSLGELCQCSDCGTIYAAEELFTKEELSQDELIGDLLDKKFGNSPILCKREECGGKTKVLYGNEFIDNLRKKYSSAIKSFLVIAREKETGRVVGFEDGYIGTFLNPELASIDLLHYENSNKNIDWLKDLGNHIDALLGFTPEKMLTLSSVGIITKYQSPFLLFDILKCFAEMLPQDYTIPGMTEVDTRNVTYKITINSGGKRVPIDGNPRRMRREYQGGLYVSHDPVRAYKETYSKGPREFLKLFRK